MSQRSLDWLLAAATCVVVLLFMGSAAFPQSAPYRMLVTATVLSYVGGLSKLFALTVGGVAAWRVSRSFGAGNPARFAWRCLAGWLLSWSCAQFVLGVHQWILQEELPFPSLADPLFVLGYGAMVVGFVFVLRAYVNSGFAFGDVRGLWVLGGVVSAVSIVVGAFVLRPITDASGTALELFLNLTYPVCDLIALVPAALLMRMTLALRGGALFRVWSFLLGGFLAMAVGDVLYAYLTMLDLQWTGPVVDLAFIMGYGLAARGVVEQRRLSA